MYRKVLTLHPQPLSCLIFYCELLLMGIVFSTNIHILRLIPITDLMLKPIHLFITILLRAIF